MDGDDDLRLSDVGNLARGVRRRVVAAARAVDRPTFPKLLADHLEVPLDDLEVVEESWAAYEQVNVQTGLDAWLGTGERTHRLVGMINHQHRQFGLGDLLRLDPYGHGPAPGNVSWCSLASGPDGEVQPAVRAGVYLVVDGDAGSRSSCWRPTRTAGSGSCRSTWSPTVRAPRWPPPPSCAGWPWCTTSSAARSSPSATRCSASAERCCSSTAGRA